MNEPKLGAEVVRWIVAILEKFASLLVGRQHNRALVFCQVLYTASRQLSHPYTRSTLNTNTHCALFILPAEPSECNTCGPLLKREHLTRRGLRKRDTFWSSQ